GVAEERPFRDDDRSPLRPHLGREIVGGRARAESDRLALVDHGGRRSGDGALLLDLESKTHVEADLELALAERTCAAADARHAPVPSQLAEVVPDGDLRHGEGLRKFRNLNVIAGFEQAQHVLHPLRLREIAEIARGVDGRDLTPAPALESMITFESPRSES